MNGYTFTFDHCVFYREVRGVSRPLVTVEFLRDGASYTWPMLVDSGADNVVLPGEMMALMGIRPEECDEVDGLTYYGAATGYRSRPLTLSLPDLRGDRPFEAPVLFVPRLDGLGYGLLGRDPTLAHLRFCLTHELGDCFFVGYQEG